MGIIVAPGDVIQLSNRYHDGVKMLFDKWTILFVVATFDESKFGPVEPGKVSRSPERVIVMPAGEPRLYDLQRAWVERNCLRVTIWQTTSPV